MASVNQNSIEGSRYRHPPKLIPVQPSPKSSAGLAPCEHARLAAWNFPPWDNQRLDPNPGPLETPGLAPPRYPFWGWTDLALVVGLLVSLLVFILLTAAAATSIWPTLRTNPVPLLLPTQVAFYFAIYLAFFFAFRLRHNKPVWTSLGWRQTVSNNKLLLLGLGGAILSPVVSAIASALHTPEVRMEILDQLANQPIILALFGIMAITIAPIFEELLFRGFLQPLFSRSLGVVAGILLTSLLFGALHAFQYKFVWQYVAAVSVVGVVLGLVRYRTGSIIASSIMHACYNSVFVVEMFFQHK